ncbi:MAG: hypothetical protein JSW11_08320 [Candidatus Heimdallarchaeota archaeon]|nr:MAG: hypothetical protein JSW11_08320 [Candidatus Heimdallarchaeota archaeon]
MSIGSKAKENLIWIIFAGIILTGVISGGIYQMIFSPTIDNNNPIDEPFFDYPGNNTNQNNSINIPESNTTMNLDGKITIEGIGTFTYVPKDIITMRPNIFQPGHFSIFDILVWLDDCNSFYSSCRC